jgi:membrane protein implicated in regulation of membrane protease activity
MSNAEREARLETVSGVAAGLTAVGVLLVALAPLAIPFLALTALFVAPLLILPLLALPLVLLAALAIKLGRRFRGRGPRQGAPVSGRAGRESFARRQRSYGMS